MAEMKKEPEGKKRTPEARRSAMYDKGKERPEPKPEKKEPSPKEGGEDGAMADGGADKRKDMLKRHEVERRDLHASHREDHRKMATRHEAEFKNMAAEQMAQSSAPGGTAQPVTTPADQESEQE